MKRRIIGLILAVSIIFSMVPVTASAGNLSDVGSHWAKAAIEFCLEKGLVTGYSGGTFGSDKNITRAEFAVIVQRAKSFPAGDNMFSDVEDGVWYESAVSALKAAGVVGGVTNDTFGPTNHLTRQEAAAILARAYALSPKDANAYASFADEAKISSWAQVAVSAMNERGYIKGKPGNYFDPTATITRGEICQILYSIYASQVQVQIKEVGLAAMNDKNRTVTSHAFAYEVKFFDLDGKELSSVPTQEVFLPYEIIVRTDEALHQLPGNVIDTNIIERVTIQEADMLMPYKLTGGETTIMPGGYVPELHSVKLLTNKPGTFVVKSVKDSTDYAESMQIKGLIPSGVTLDGKDVTVAQYIAFMSNALSTVQDYDKAAFSRELRGLLVNLKDSDSVSRINAAKVLSYAISKYVKGKPISDCGYDDVKALGDAQKQYADIVTSYFLMDDFSDGFYPDNYVSISDAAANAGKLYYLPKKALPATLKVDAPAEKNSDDVIKDGIVSVGRIDSLPLSTKYSLKVNGVQVYVYDDMNISFARVSVPEGATFEVTAAAKIRGAKLSPMSLGLAPRTFENKMVFTTTNSEDMMVEVEQLGKLLIFVNKPEVKPVVDGSKIVDITKVAKADPTGKTDCTEAVNAYLASIKGKGLTVYFPTGTYLITPLKPQDNTTIYLSSRAMITVQLGKYKIPPVSIQDTKDVTLTGRGMINGEGVRARKANNNNGVKNIRVLRAVNVSISGIMSLNSAEWNTHTRNCNNVVIDGLDIINRADLEWTDGIDIDSTKNATVKNCFIYAGDDCVSIKTVGEWMGNDYSDVDKVLIENCLFHSSSTGYKLGGNTAGDHITNVTMRDCDFLNGDRGMQILDSDNSIMTNLLIENCRIDKAQGDQQNLLFCVLIRPEDENTMRNGRIVGATFRNIRAHMDAISGSEVTGYSEKNCARDITFENIVIAGKHITSAEELRLSTNEFAYNIVVK